MNTIKVSHNRNLRSVSVPENIPHRVYYLRWYTHHDINIITCESGGISGGVYNASDNAHAKKRSGHYQTS